MTIIPINELNTSNKNNKNCAKLNSANTVISTEKN